MFCRNCGTQLPDDSKFCSQCGTATAGPVPSAQTNYQQTTRKHKVMIFRESQFYVINPAVNISINGQKSRSIENGEMVILELDEGLYVFEFSLHVRRRTVNLNLTRDTQITLRWDRITGALKAEVN